MGNRIEDLRKVLVASNENSIQKLREIADEIEVWLQKCGYCVCLVTKPHLPCILKLHPFKPHLPSILKLHPFKPHLPSILKLHPIKPHLTSILKLHPFKPHLPSILKLHPFKPHLPSILKLHPFKFVFCYKLCLYL